MRAKIDGPSAWPRDRRRLPRKCVPAWTASLARSGRSLPRMLLLRRSSTAWAPTAGLAAVGPALLVGGYALQIATPLRVDIDVVTYLTVAASAADGRGFLDNGHVPVYPPGYPALVAGLEQVGVATSAAFVAVNVVAVVGMVLAAYTMYRRGFGASPARAAGLCALVLASFVPVKYAAMAMADVPFAAAAAVVLALLTGVAARPAGAPLAWGRLAVAVAVLGLALSLRTAGIALVPAVAAAVVAAHRASAAVALGRLRARPGRLAGAALAGAAVLAGAGWALLQTGYGRDALAVYARYGGTDVLVHNLGFKAMDWGEIALNAPAGRLGAVGVPGAVVAGAGVLAVVVLGTGLWLGRSRPACWPAAAFLVATAAMLVLWPGRGARFWLPVWPVAVGMVGIVAAQVEGSQAGRVAVRVVAVAFVAIGVAALAFSARISFAGPAFAAVYAGGTTLEPAYAAAAARRPPPDTADWLTIRAYPVLVRYGPRPASPPALPARTRPRSRSATRPAAPPAQGAAPRAPAPEGS